MAVALVIEWDNGKVDVVPIQTLRQVEEGWRPYALKLGLELIPEFYSAFSLEPCSLPQVKRELTTFREAISSEGEGYTEWVEAVDRLLSAIERLSTSGGWSASIG
jgi:hypothetical protein